jgi:hypothetical protein
MNSVLRHTLLAFLLACSPLAVVLAASPAEIPPDVQAVTSRLMQQFDRPEQPLHVPTVVIEGHHAVAAWLQGERGGRALLVRDQGRWEVVACAGDSLLEASTLQHAGLDTAAANRLAARIRTQEQHLTAPQRRQLSTFEGMVRFGRGEHPAH